jgi:hypothetical protein
MNPRSGSRLRLPALLAVAHASLALYFWVCAPDVNLVIIPARLWEVLTWSWVGWPALLVVLDGRLAARLVDWAWSLVDGQRHHCGTPALRPNPSFEQTRR